MGIVGMFKIAALISAFVCASLFVYAVLSFAAIKPNSILFGGEVKVGHFAWFLRNGVSCTRPLARMLLSCRSILNMAEEVVWKVESWGFSSNPVALISVVLFASLLVLIGVGIGVASLIGAVAVVVLLWVGIFIWARTMQDKRRDNLQEAVPDALQSMVVCFQSGFSLQQTLNQVAQESEGVLKELFERACRHLSVGQNLSTALAELKQGPSTPELSFVAVALDVQHQAGGSMSRVLETTRDAVESELELKRSLRVQTAQARLSARVVSVLPFVLITLFSLITEDFLAPFFSSATGIALLCLALGMQLCGILVVRRMLAVEVV